MEINGFKFNTPKDVPQFLEARYPDWKTPRKKVDGWHPMFGKEKK